MKPCRECGREVSEQAVTCPGCGAPYPARAQWDGWGVEWKSRLAFAGLPLVHICFKYHPNRMPVPARGIIAVGQFAVGFVTISQFGLGVVSVSQFTVGLYALAQFGIAWHLLAQIGVFFGRGYGQFVIDGLALLRQLLG